MDIERFADYLVNLFLNSESAEEFVSDPASQLEVAGAAEATPAELNAALDIAVGRLPATTAQAVEQSLATTRVLNAGGSISAGPQIQGGPSQQVVQAAAARAAQVQAPPEVREVVREVTQHVTHVHENVQHVTNVVEEGDTNIDNRVITQIEADGDVELDVDSTNVTATEGGVAAGDDIRDSSVNTGEFQGIQNSGRGVVDAEDAVIGDGNTVIEDSNVGALAQGGGDATNVNAEVANLGDGDLTNVESSGDGQTIVGNANETTGDVDVDVDGVEGNANLAIGDGNQQQANQANTDVVDQSVNDNSVNTQLVDNSVDDSFNTVDSFDQDNDLTSTTLVDQSIEDSFNPEDSFDVEDNSVTEVDQDLDQTAIDLDRSDDNDIDIDD